MATISLGNVSPAEGEIKHIDLKQASIQIHPVPLDTPSLTPATTPDQNSPLEENAMAGKKIFSLEQPTDKARELAAKLTLEEQVRTIYCHSPKKPGNPTF
jgi:beta-glucosidase|tara:strand:+ start:23982 stop:24281 length:300 start_codon:yes stop_codon:yes gene_type:complete